VIEEIIQIDQKVVDNYTQKKIDSGKKFFFCALFCLIFVKMLLSEMFIANKNAMVFLCLVAFTFSILYLLEYVFCHKRLKFWQSSLEESKSFQKP